ncbi:MAG: DsbA family protein, partial [Nannocystaceae bacterium]
NFAAWAGEMGLDVAKFKADYADPALAKMVDEDMAVSSKFGARGTPAFFVNGRFISGAQPFANFKALIEEEKAKAQAFVDAGTPRAQVLSKVYEGAEASVAKPAPKAASKAPAGG